MSKETTDLTKITEASEGLTLQNSKANAAELLKDFSSVSSAVLQTLTQEYLQLKENTTYNLVFTAMTNFKGEGGKEVEAVVLVDKDASTFINGSTVLVNSLKKVTSLPCLVRIVTGSLQKSSSGAGKYLDMEIFVIPKAVEKS